jgi:hypothetical protein
VSLFFGVAAIALAIAWLPIFMHFFRAWRGRRDPVSLAICLLVAFVSWGSAIPYWIVTNNDAQSLVFLILVFDLIICVTFYISLRAARKKLETTVKGD